MGMLVCAAITFVAALPVIAFPKRLSNDTAGSTADSHDLPTAKGENGLKEPPPAYPHSPKLACAISSGTGRCSHDSLYAQPVHVSKADAKLDRVLEPHEYPRALRPHANQVGCIVNNTHRATSESALPPSARSPAFLRRAASFACYPQKVNPAKQTNVSLTSLQYRLGNKLKAFSRVLRRVLANPIWLGVTFTSVVEQSIVAAFLPFAPKYLQDLFQVPAYMASIHTGAVVVPSSAVGILTGALLMRRYRPQIHRALAGMSVMIAATVLTTITLMLLNCPGNRVAGLTATYDGKPWPWLYGPAWLTEPELIAPCNADCQSVATEATGGASGCSRAQFNPVCWQRASISSSETSDSSTNGPGYLTFFNPCFAGCQTRGRHRTLEKPNDPFGEEFLDCRCVTLISLNPSGATHRNQTRIRFGRVTPGRCPADCSQYIVFLVVLFAHILFTGILQNPSNVITLSCVAPEDSSVALGLQLFFMRTLAYIPAPIYFGQLFDLVCQYRLVRRSPLGPEDTTCDHRGPTDTLSSTTQLHLPSSKSYTGGCLQYNLDGLPVVWLGAVLTLKLISLIGSAVTWRVARRKAILSQSTSTTCTESLSPKLAKSAPTLRESAVSKSEKQSKHARSVSATVTCSWDPIV
ncbi:hypothetical protein PHET_06136 [Paragonimus heterotremus]|uniref:Solute carrier organic anion transporter family member n=1 Tax=Paragonimus heterotremus TaxID=100268 RepID=A0A8J4SX64_9TREM|nr:hypothetical protein PHET_06136 [Paragonimus heterotremus]